MDRHRKVIEIDYCRGVDDVTNCILCDEGMESFVFMMANQSVGLQMPICMGCAKAFADYCNSQVDE